MWRSAYIGEYVEEQVFRDGVAEKRSDASSGGGEELDKSEGPLGQSEPWPEMVGGGLGQGTASSRAI